MVKLETIIERAKRVILDEAVELVGDMDKGHVYGTPICGLTQIIISRDDDKSIRQSVVRNYIGADPFCWWLLTPNDVDHNDIFEVQYPDGEIITAEAELHI